MDVQLLESERRFPGARDTLTRGLTAGVWVLSLAVSVGVVVTPGVPVWVGLACAGVTGWVLFVAWLYAPHSYVVDGTGVRVLRRIGELIVSREDLTEVRQIDKAELGWVVRLWGVGGLHGYFGLHWSKKLGDFDLWATAQKPMVLLGRRDERPMIVTPADPAAFVAKLRPGGGEAPQL